MPTITRKIQIIFDTDDKKQVKEWYKKLYDWQYAVHRAANYTSTHQFVQENLKDFFYFTEEFKIKLADINKDAEGVLNTSRPNTTYRLLSDKFKGDVPMGIISATNNQVASVFGKEKKEYWKGTRSLRTYKKTMPIPTPMQIIRGITLGEKKYDYHFTVSDVKFRTNFGRDRSGNKEIFDRAMSGEYKFCDSSIQLDGTKTFLLAVFQFDKDSVKVDKDIAAVAELGIDTPIIVEVGGKKLLIGDKEEFLHRRLAIQGALKRAQISSRYNKGGKGIQKKIAAINRYKESEKNYVKTRVHAYTRKLIDLCIKHGAGTLILKDQKEKQEEAKQDELLLRNWSYFSMIEKIKYKAKFAGIEVVIE